ncbi:MAG: helix-turn-helix domain-containing protein [Myxococcota bacterium]
MAVTRLEVPARRIAVLIETGEAIDVGGERYTNGFVAGLGHPATRCRFVGTQAGVQMNLTLSGARALLDAPPSSLAGACWPLEAAIDDASALVARIREGRTPAEALASLFRWAGRRLAGRPGAVRCESDRWGDAILRSGSLTEFARSLGMSHRRFVQHSRQETGLRPGTFRRLHRFERACASLARATSLAEAAISAGFADQSHMSREVRHFTARTPRELQRFLKAPLGAVVLSGSDNPAR